MSHNQINDINVGDVNVPRIHTHEIPYTNIPIHQVPVTLQIGNPIVDMPGCVEMHRDNKNHVSRLPFDKDLVNQDEKGMTILCPHGEYPSYEAMDYQPEQLIITQEVPPPPVQPPPTPPEFKTDAIPKDDYKDPKCPGPNNLRVGDTTQSGEERVIGHQLVPDPANPVKKICETLYEPTTALEKYLPPANQASTVTALAVVATAGAAATPLLIRVIKPVIKKIWKTIQKKLGKDVKEPSRQLKQTNSYREKKGLPPLK